MEKELVSEEKINLLDEAIKAYERLLDLKYLITLAHKGKRSYLELIFLASGFVHLAGINKLKDLSRNSNVKSMYRELKQEVKLKKRIVNSLFFSRIIPRLQTIIKLEENFSNYRSNNYVKFIQKNSLQYSLIDYDYFVRANLGADNYYYFIRKSSDDRDNDSFILISTFVDNIKNYSLGQQLMSLLSKVLINTKTGEECVIYNLIK